MVLWQIINQNDEEIKIPNNTDVGHISKFKDDRKEVSMITNPPSETPYNYDVVINKENLTDVQQKQLIQLLHQNSDIFGEEITKLGRTGLVEHFIDVGDTKPIHQKPYRLSPAQKEILEQEVNKMLHGDIIEESVSPWSSPIIMVPKPDGTVRFCIDFKKLNAHTIKDSFPLPRIDEVLDSLHGAKWFSTLDLLKGYWQIRMADESKEKTAFTAPHGLYQFIVLPFGLTNAPGSF